MTDSPPTAALHRDALAASVCPFCQNPGLPNTLLRFSTDPEKPTAASLLNISNTLVQKAVASGEIPSIKVGKRVLVPTAGLHRMLIESEHKDGAA